MGPILSSLAAGYSAQEILNFLARTISDLSPKIAEAAAEGYSPDEILDFLKGFNQKDLKKFKSNKRQGRNQIEFQFPQEEEPKTDLESAFNIWYGPPTGQKRAAQLNETIGDQTSAVDTIGSLLGNVATGAAYTGGSLLLMKALQKAGPAAATILQSILRNRNTTPSQDQDQDQDPIDITPIKPGANPNPNALQLPYSSAPNQPGVPLLPNPQQPSPDTASTIQEATQIRVQDPPTVDSVEIFSQMGITERIDNLVKAGNNPQQVGVMLDFMLTPTQKKWLKTQTDEPLENLVSRYLESKPLVPDTQPETIQETEVVQEQVVQPNSVNPLSTPLAITDNGQIAEVEEIKDGIAKLKINGQTKRRKVEDLEEEPPEIENLVEDLINSIPEQERSAVLGFANYQPNFSFEYGGQKFDIPMMAIQFQSGDLYLYPGVSQDEYSSIVEKALPAKTSGDNVWNAWTAGQASRGASFQQIKKELEAKYGKNFIKFKASEGYDYWKTVREIIKRIEKRKRQSKKSN